LAREMIDDSNKNIDLIAKIESRKALDNLDGIIEAVEGIIVARGDLGVEVGVERVPFHQKEMIKKANRRGKIAITATQMLESMIQNPVPTRAEVSDVSNAILDGSDVVMLSGETAVGDYPIQSVKAMADIIEATEEDFHKQLIELTPDIEQGEEKLAASMSNAAARVANEIGAAAIIAPTSSGFTARMVSNTYSICPIIALSFNPVSRQKAALYRNVRPYELGKVTDTDKLMTASIEAAKEMGYAKEGDQVVLITGLPITQPGVTNFLHVMDVA
jgi:pyruvate kinase